jgi:hypothetical protein
LLSISSSPLQQGVCRGDGGAEGSRCQAQVGPKPHTTVCSHPFPCQLDMSRAVPDNTQVSPATYPNLIPPRSTRQHHGNASQDPAERQKKKEKFDAICSSKIDEHISNASACAICVADSADTEAWHNLSTLPSSSVSLRHYDGTAQVGVRV